MSAYWTHDEYGCRILVQATPFAGDVTREANLAKERSTPHYTSDTGNGPRSGTDTFAGGELKLGNQSGPDASSLEEAFAKINRLDGCPMLLTQTTKYGPHPGAFYAKAFATKGANWNTLNRVLKDNQDAGRFAVRKSWVCHPDMCWN